MGPRSWFSSGSLRSKNWLQSIGQVGYGLIIFLPLLGLGWALANHCSPISSDLYNTRRWLLLLHSAGLACCVSLAGTGTALLAASSPLLHTGKLTRTIRTMFLASAVLPPYIHALAWYSLLSLLRFPLRSGWFVAAWVQTLAFLPIALIIIQAGFQRVDDDMVNAARLNQSSSKVLWCVVLPLVKPWIRSSASILFFLSLLDYSIPYLFGKNVYALEVFADFSAFNQPARAVWVALPLAILLFLALSSALTGARAFATPFKHRKNHWFSTLSIPGWHQFLQFIALCLAVLTFAAPVLGLILLVENPSSLISSITSGYREAGYTFAIALSASMISLPFALSAAQGMSQSGKASKIGWIISLVAITIPPALVGISLASFLGDFSLNFLYGQDAGLILGYLARFTPLAALILYSQEHLIDRSLLDAAQVFQRNAAWGLLRVRIPLLLPGLASAAGLVAILSAGELAATVILIPPGRSTLALRIFNFMHYGSPEAVAGLSLLLVFLTFSCGMLMEHLLRITSTSQESSVI